VFRFGDQRLAGTEPDEPLVFLDYLLVFKRRIHRELKNAMRSDFWAADKALKKFLENVPPKFYERVRIFVYTNFLTPSILPLNATLTTKY
jgi:hypothetical protein